MNRHKRLLSIIMVFVLILAATGCGTTNGGTSADEATDSDEQAAAEATMSGKTGTETAEAGNTETGTTEAESGTAEAEFEPIVYEAANGKVTIQEKPERVVVVAGSYVGYFLALGLKPVGITETALANPYFEGKTDGIENIGDGTSVEKILTLDPDLIVVFAGQENLEQLEKIAPTVAVEYGKLNYRDQLIEFGKMTGREKEAHAWIESWNERIAAAKPEVRESVGDRTVSILQPYAKGIYVFGHNYARGGEIIYGEFELKAPPLVQEEVIDSGKGWGSLSLEMLPDYAGDYIFTSAWSGDDADPSVVYEISIWKNLPAVQNGNVFKLNKKASVFNDPVSLDAQLDFFVEKLTQE